MDLEVLAQLEIVSGELFDTVEPFLDGIDMPGDFITAITEAMGASSEYKELMDLIAPGQTKLVIGHLLARIGTLVLNSLAPIQKGITPPIQ